MEIKKDFSTNKGWRLIEEKVMVQIDTHMMEEIREKLTVEFYQQNYEGFIFSESTHLKVG